MPCVFITLVLHHWCTFFSGNTSRWSIGKRRGTQIQHYISVWVSWAAMNIRIQLMASVQQYGYVGYVSNSAKGGYHMHWQFPRELTISNSASVPGTKGKREATDSMSWVTMYIAFCMDIVHCISYTMCVLHTFDHPSKQLPTLDCGRLEGMVFLDHS